MALPKTRIRAVGVGLVALANLGVLGCGSHDEARATDSYRFDEAVVDHTIALGASSYLVAGAHPEGGIEAVVLEVTPDGVLASKPLTLASDHRFDDLQAIETSNGWLVTAPGCAAAPDCETDAVYAFQINREGSDARSLGAVKGTSGFNVALLGRLDDVRVFAQEQLNTMTADASPRLSSSTRFLALDTTSGEAEVLPWTPPDYVSDPGVVGGPGEPTPTPSRARSACSSNEQIYVLESTPRDGGWDRSLYTVRADSNEPSQYPVVLEQRATAAYLRCDAKSVSVFTVDNGAHRASVYPIGDDGELGPPVSTTYEDDWAGGTTGSVILMELADTSPHIATSKEEALTVVEGGAPSAPKQLLMFANGAWQSLDQTIDGNSQAYPSNDGRSILVQLGNTFTGIRP